jgi:glycosyltransferase involved in cell wall biosynthesis
MPSVEPFPFSAIICTRDRAPQLERCLQKFNEAQAFHNSWELIVVDNNSSDHTKTIIEKFAASVPFRVRYVFEGMKGLSNARNRGIAETSASIIAFTDDDCLIDRQWASTIVHEFSANPSLAVLGGRVEIGDQNGQRVGTRSFPDRMAISSFDELFRRMIGCNMAFSKKVFQVIGGFDPLLGKGTRLGSAEDLDLLYRALKVPLCMAYVPEAIVFHAHGRKTMSSIQQVTDEYARGRGGFYWKHVAQGDWNLARRAGREIINLTRASLARQNRHAMCPSAPRVLGNLVMGAFYRLMGG